MKLNEVEDRMEQIDDLIAHITEIADAVAITLGTLTQASKALGAMADIMVEQEEKRTGG